MAIQSNQSIPHHIIIMAVHPEPADEAMRRTGIPWHKEWLLIIYTQVLVINNQSILDLDDAAVSSDVGGILLCRTAECMACIAESKLFCYLGIPWCNGGCPIDRTEFVTWLHLWMLINLYTPLANPHCSRPVNRNEGEIIDIILLPIFRPDNYDLQAVCISLEQTLLPPTMPATKRQITMQKLGRNTKKVLRCTTELGKCCFRCTMLPADSLSIMWKA